MLVYTENLNILILDDDPLFRSLSQSILKERYNIMAVDRPSIAFKALKNENIDILICDFHLPEMNGLEVLKRVKKKYPHIEIIMISDSNDMNIVIEALRVGAADYFKKPFTAAEMWMSIERTRKVAELNKNIKSEKVKNSLLKEEVNRELGLTIIGKSKAVDDIKKQMTLVAKTPDTSVLIIGESGTGKELVARGIHNMSSRKNEFFGAVNMSAVPEALFESEFFGHKRGSFTGAIADKAGWFESSNKGTLFFDEIGEMSISLQVKLLRVLEDRTFIKVGTQKEQKYDIRIVTATNKSLEELLNSKYFRLDLFHRLGTFIIQLPPLRERKSDIPELADYFLAQLTKKMGKNIKGIDKEVYTFLKSHTFQGNIRELKNLMERAVIVCQSEQIQIGDINSFGLLNTSILTNNTKDIYDLKELEKLTIIKALEKVNYNKSEAAKLLNLEWNALYRRIQKYNIELPL